MNFAGKVVLVTGASRGIGRAIAKKFAEYQAQVCINCRSNEDQARELAAEIAMFGPEPMVVKADIRSLEAVKNMISQIKARFGQIDVLVNNAGVTHDGFLMTMKEDDWDQVIGTNLKGLYNASKSVLMPMITKKHGKIINISSVSGIMGTVGQTSYAASKAGVIGFTRSLAKEVAKFNIMVNAIAPGFIETEMIDAIPAALREEYLQSIPLKRWGKAEEIAEMACFLASDAANYITGQVIVIDGGLTA